jgi:hypothetical protein
MRRDGGNAPTAIDAKMGALAWRYGAALAFEKSQKILPGNLHSV